MARVTWTSSCQIGSRFALGSTRRVGAPVVTVSSATLMIDRSFIQTNESILRLVEAGILRQVTVGRRNRAFEASEIISAFMDSERQLANPEGDTRISDPVRHVPRRP